MLKISNLYVAYDDRIILNDLNLEVQDSEFVMIVGSNGAGKSTLLNAIAGTIPADKGSIELNGKAVNCQNTSVVLQDPKMGTIGHMTIEENLAFALKRGQNRYLLSHKNKDRLDLFRDQLAALGMGLENRLYDLASSLSGGQRQALSLIMATITDADLLLFDEITSALDPKMADIIMNLTSKLVKSHHKTALMITHNMDHAKKFGDRVLTMQDGVLV